MIGHIYEDDEDGQFHIQSLEAHLCGTAKLAGQFLEPLNLKHIGEILGWLHDLGKAKPEFQNYIRSVSGYDTSIKNFDRVTHAATGAKYVAEKYKGFWDFFLIPPIIAHHTGLLDYDRQDAGLRKEKTIPEFNLPSLPSLLECVTPSFTDIAQFNHFIRILYSALVDADFLDTEAFMSEERSELRTSVTSSSLADLLSLLEVHMSKLQNNGADTPVNRIRKDIYEECLAKSTSDQGVYSLTVPTGGGKTLSSIMWALRHAVHHGLERVIVAIPYTSIIIQTASIFRSIFGAENVLE
ncbi:MAG TPA: CRISPR-associated endonuclease Cas3'', partial [Bacteroidaceae bacterium]|nr:CRISPR-associated endonuclease Cas3'' [Bacteroidaceae bacterium]